MKNYSLHEAEKVLALYNEVFHTNYNTSSFVVGEALDDFLNFILEEINFHQSTFENIELTISGIKCDKCDYRNDEVLFSDYPKWVNRECPRCGENLLTQSDYDECIALAMSADVVNSIPPDDLEKLVAELPSKRMDAALDFMNDRMEKTGEDTWTIK